MLEKKVCVSILFSNTTWWKLFKTPRLVKKKNSELVMKQDLGETDRHWERSVFLKCGMVVQSKETKTMWE